MVIEFWLGISEPTVMFLWVPSRVNLTLEFAGFKTGKMSKQITYCTHVFLFTKLKYSAHFIQKAN